MMLGWSIVAFIWIWRGIFRGAGNTIWHSIYSGVIWKADDFGPEAYSAWQASAFNGPILIEYSNVIVFQSIEAHRRTWTRQRLSLKPGSSNTTQSHQILGSKQLSHEPMSLPSFKKISWAGDRATVTCNDEITMMILLCCRGGRCSKHEEVAVVFMRVEGDATCRTILCVW